MCALYLCVLCTYLAIHVCVVCTIVRYVPVCKYYGPMYATITDADSPACCFYTEEVL